VVETRPGRIVCLLIALAVMAGACTTSAPPRGRGLLIVDKSFDIKTADPHHELSVTGAILFKALYSTLLTFEGGDESRPVPAVAASFTSSEDARTFTFNLRQAVMFSDGTPLTAADVVFSFNRVINLAGAPSVLLSGVSVSAPNASTVVIRSTNPNPALPYIVTNPALAIVNSRVVKSNGGVDAPGAATTDTAGAFMDLSSAGSGPYILDSFGASEIRVTANSRYWGPKAAYRRVLIRNMDAPTQLSFIPSGNDEIALDLSAAQAGTVASSKSVHIHAAPGTELVFLFANDNARVSSLTPNPHFRNAVRSALDYDGLVRMAGLGAIQAPGVVPSMLLGALPSWIAPHRDLQRARSELALSGIKDPTVTLAFATNTTVGGLPTGTLASVVKSELSDAGITVNLAGAPLALATADYHAGREQMGLWSVTPTYADPNYYLAFVPGHALALRAGWPAGSNPDLESLGVQAGTTADPPTRAQLFQHMQGQLNDVGPYFPLFQPGRVVVATTGIMAIDVNPSWSIDLATVGG